MKLIRLSKENDDAVSNLVKDANLNGLLTIPKAANLAIQKGLPAVRKLLVKQNQKRK